MSSLGVYAKEIEDILTDIADLEIKMKKIQSQNDRLLSPSPIEGMSYKKFSNFLKKADNKLKYSHDILLVDKMIKMVFSNLYISRQKIVSGRLNPLFLRYQKEVLSLNGVPHGEYCEPIGVVEPLRILSFNNMWSLLEKNELEVQYVYENKLQLPIVDFNL